MRQILLANWRDSWYLEGRILLKTTPPTPGFERTLRLSNQKVLKSRLALS
jgi:hypothetical protein